ncbi:MAG: copper amine oxidase N-terminal domain-containing protein [Vulcanimicrobiaceae bacterium]
MRSSISLRVTRGAFLAAALAAGVFALAGVVRADERASVVIDGRFVPMNPPAILREGSVFVPVRGVFENLGASVVFSNGRITAHGKNGETVVMTVGQRSASVNGHHVMLDNPPFIVGASTFVPLRFVSEALGASVSFDNRSKTVHIYSNASAPQPPYQTQPPPSYTVQLQDHQPRPGTTVRSVNPPISANFNQSVDPNSIRISVDGRAVTQQASIGNNGFSVTPPFDLRAGTRGVSVSGTSSTGQQFTQNWSFNVTPELGLTRNYVQIRSPGPGSTVTASSFQVAGRTLPLAQVTVGASTASQFPNYPGIIGPGFTRQVRADPLGNFSTNVSIPNSSGFVRVFVQSVAPDGSSAEATVTVPST